jgi:protein TonB
VDQPPREKAGNPRPRYPRAAARRGVEGHVDVRIFISEEGRVRKAEIVDVAGHDAFRDAVQNVVGRWRFEPAVHDGRRVAVIGLKRIRFELES